jgi:hypothetical protein
MIKVGSCNVELEDPFNEEQETFLIDFYDVEMNEKKIKHISIIIDREFESEEFEASNTVTIYQEDDFKADSEEYKAIQKFTDSILDLDTDEINDEENLVSILSTFS